ncbi:MAG: hypothetical protein Q8N98_02185, partial [bacterium]|nr:hypothetical protein [bacterium]
YFLFISGLFAAKWVGEGLGRVGRGGERGAPPRGLCPAGRWGKTKKTIVIGLLVVLTVPGALGTLRHYLPKRPAARVSFEELEALDFLRKKPTGVVLTFPFNNDERFSYPDPRPLFSYETTAYIAALSNKQTFLEDEMNLEILGTDWRPRRKMIEEFFKTDNTGLAKDFLRDNKISYLYLLKHQALRVRPEEIGLAKIFDNGMVKVYFLPREPL